MENKKVIEVMAFTDPICTWCWGSEPLLRKLETRYGDNLKVKFIMGGLVEDIREFYDSFNDIGGDAENSNKQIVKHWAEASARHGMPVKADGFKLFSNDHPSSYPQNIAYKAAQMEDEKLADKFLRRMREASEAEARQTNREEVLIELASEVGLDVGKFIERISDGSAEKLFREDLKITREYGVRGFPTFILKYGDKKIMLRGFQSYDSVKSVIKSLTGNEVLEIIQDKTENNVMNFIKKYERVVPVEIKEAFDYLDSELKAVIENLINKNLIKVNPAGNGFFIETTINPMSCNSDSGLCGF